ncbi:uncharacterized protein LOC142977365 [Anticarsia gemmatalis]|uniref:uncharacterized protein LOC142977365 n=1 Tax=Anticarsia gemmatalis TaxID=129554 RepID=UPI003F773903
MEMLKQQQESFDTIKTLCSNYKKDSKSRKTEEYLTKRLEFLENTWKEFEKRHETLIQTCEEKNINYFTEDVFSKTQALYETIKMDMLDLLKQLKGQKVVSFDLTDMLNEGTDDNLKRSLTKQECNFKALDRAMSKIDINSLTEKWEFEDHLTILKSKWDSIEKQHWELEAILKGSDTNYYTMFVEMEDKYDELRRTLNRKIWSAKHYEKSAPRIQIPDFSGNYNNWVSFKDLFLETIHNNPMINKAQKMQHLKTKLKGEAERLVQHLSVSAENYTSCWDILTQRYDNRRLLFTSFMNTMLDLPNVQHPNSYNVKKMHDVITECLNGLTNIGLDITTWDPIIVHLMAKKLDPDTYSDYTKELQNPREVPNLNELLYFLENKFLTYETMTNAKKEPSNVSKQSPYKPLNKYHSNTTKSNYNDQTKNFKKSYHTVYGHCPQCDGNHVLRHCPKFLEMDVPQRNNIVVKLHLCKNCLYSHGSSECKSNKVCRDCNLRHHTLLHNSSRNKTLNRNMNGNSNENSPSTSQRPSTSNQQISNHLSNNETEILLTTVQLQIKSANGTYVTLRALLDQGSQVNLITENAAQLLRLPRQRLNATVTGIGAVSGDCKGRIQLTCQSIHTDYEFQTEALILKKLTNNLPSSSFEKTQWPHLENLKLADPEFNISRPVDVLLGADVYSNILLDGVLRGSTQAPIAQQTHLGWILCGKLKTFNCHVTLVDMTELNKFWETEDVSPCRKQIIQDDECERYYTDTTQRSSDNKYIVKMPMCPNYNTKMGKSKAIAISQFLQLEKRLERNNKLASMYKEFIKEYIELGHMKPATPITSAVTDCYLPHHGVLREHAETTKLRVVFNASQKTSTGFSLNNVLEKGPNLQKDIQALVLRWRSYKYAYTADIEKMYRCIWISEEQQPLQKIIWRNSPSEKLQEFQLCTVTYGTKCAPWLAMRTLKQLAKDDGHKHPNAAAVLQNDLFVDDLVCGRQTLEEGVQLQTSLIDLLRGGGMNLRKWSANHPALLANLTNDQVSSNNTFDFKQDESHKTLGLGWNTTTDTFSFNWNMNNNFQPTKRYLLSEISKMYDPLGWLSPLTVTAKLLFQRVWTSKIGWDETLPTDISNEWIKLKNELPMVKNIQLNRWIGGTESNLELLGFCDACEKAYACVVYSRVINEHGQPITTLLAAKTRVAPISQKITLPRLELCGALLLSQLIEKIREAYAGYTITVRAWSDSKVALAWIQGDTTRWEKYVANRVTNITQIIPSQNWNYVKSELNPADCASRGLYPAKLLNFTLWWNGPDFLQLPEKEVTLKTSTCLATTNIGLEKQSVKALPKNHDTHFINKLINNCSTLTRVTRVTAWVFRFITNSRDKRKSDTNYLTTEELTAANEQIIKYVQQTLYEQEYKQLQKQETVGNKSSIYKLHPYVNDKGIIRVGGRLKNSILPPEMKNPAILPRDSRFTRLLVEQAHLATLHGGARLTLAYIRQRYWIVGGNRLVKAILRHCVRCHRYKPTENNQIMGDLPPQRVIPSRPFTHTGVDFTGHVEIKLNKGRGVKTSKGYIAIFVCMATKAVHIELVSDLSTETFIAAFQRMSARRGTPQHMYSDCGTNFVGASKILRQEFEEFKQILSADFFNEIAKMEVKWHFNAPAWPSAGGLWESAVKSMKHHLRRVLGDQKLTFEEFSTLLAQIEACMNSRPLCPLTEDPEEFYNYLTPGHFLTGGPTMSLPLSDHSDIHNIDLRRRWQLTEHMLQQFWKRWSNDYLTQLQTRCKWHKPVKNIKEGDIVLVKDNNMPPGKWAMGRVQELHPGTDGYVRVTTVKTQNGTIKRPIVKLSPLPLQTEISETTNTEKKDNICQTTCDNNPQKTKKQHNKYQKDIEAIQGNEQHLLELVKNQTSIVELENKILKKNADNINRQFTMIDSFINDTNWKIAKIESAMEVMMATSYFNSVSLTSYLLINNLRKMQEILFDSLTDIYKGHMDVQLLTPVGLIEQLNVIAGRLPKSLTLPVEDITFNSTVNNIVTVTHHNYSWNEVHKDFTQQLKEMDEQLAFQQKNEVLSTRISSHDVHQYAICYTLLGGISVAVIVWFCKKRKTVYCIKPKSKQPVLEPKHEDIELQSLQRGKCHSPEEAPHGPTAQTTSQQLDFNRHHRAAANNLAFNFD